MEIGGVNTMSNGDDKQPDVPEDKTAFSEVLKKYRIGLKNEFYNTIIEDIATTGGELVFEKPELLMKKLADWHSHIDPPTRRKIINYWFAKKNVPVPKEVIEVAGLSESDQTKLHEKTSEEQRRAETEKKKYVVDRETGAISVAKKDERPALDWDEATLLSKRIKDEKGTGEKEPPFIQGPEGNWLINPAAKGLSGVDLMAYDALTKSREEGEKRTPMEILSDQAKSMEAIRSVFGGGKESSLTEMATVLKTLQEVTGGGKESSLSEMATTLKTLKEVTGGDEDTKNLLAGIYKLVKEGEGGKGEPEAVKALRDEVKDLTSKLEDREKERLNDLISGLRTELASVRGDLTKTISEARSTDEYGIMSEGLKVVDHRMGAIENILRGALGKAPPLLAEGKKKVITEGISEQVVAEADLDSLAQTVFYESK